MTAVLEQLTSDIGFFERALIEAVLAGALAGLVGTLVVLRKRAFFTTALTHATFPGAMVAAVLGFSVVLGSAVFSVLLVALMTIIARSRGQGGQVAAGVVLTFGFALGAILQAANPSLPISVESFLVGSILTVGWSDIALTAIVLALAAIVLALRGRHIIFATVDDLGYRAAGYRAWVAEALTVTLIAATVVAIMPAIGAILAIALVVGPAAAARLLVTSTTAVFALAPVIGALAGVIGVVLSRELSVSAGGAITLVVAALVGLAVLARRLSGVRWRRDEAEHLAA
ncbi:metal ABC transporter permease [Microcella sp.]|uniref:metal ABC transporter permease n=1 Tax=Microcella sp. TaxID=1913979 RepID=UPI0026154C8D|nr:metal ABC transporter permease [Microcella sp.]